MLTADERARIGRIWAIMETTGYVARADLWFVLDLLKRTERENQSLQEQNEALRLRLDDTDPTLDTREWAKENK